MGTDGTLTPADYYATLSPGAVLGFSGTAFVPGHWPSAFNLNGMPCQIASY